MRLLIVSFYTALDHFSVACFSSLSSLSRDNCFYIGQVKKTIFQVNSYTLYLLVYSETMLHIIIDIYISYLLLLVDLLSGKSIALRYKLTYIQFYKYSINGSTCSD